MKQSEARVRIIQEWDRWIVTQAIEQDRPTGKDSLKFFHELQDTGSQLLDFQSRGQDKWRIIHAWLLGADRLFDDWISAAPRIAPSRRMRPDARPRNCPSDRYRFRFSRACNSTRLCAGTRRRARRTLVAV